MQNYFAAANTEAGFVGWFDDIFNPREIDFTYIIKGGSGTGKSTLMRKVAAKAVDVGGECEYFYCSSDPTSLDGIIFTLPSGKRIAMLDGTAPHTHDPKFPGATEQIVNLGEYWCDDILKGQKNEIIALSDKKKALFSRAYSNFQSAATLVRSQLEETKHLILNEKLEGACNRLLTQRMREYKVKPDTSKERIRGLSALSTHGEVRFDSFSDVERVYLAVDFMDSTPFLFDALISAAKRLGLDYDRAPAPLMPSLTEALRFPEISTSVVSYTEREDVKPINMSRFVDRDAASMSDRHKRRLIRKSARELIDIGLSSLREVRTVHSQMERIYIGAMDFTRLGEATGKLLGRIFT